MFPYRRTHPVPILYRLFSSFACDSGTTLTVWCPQRLCALLVLCCASNVGSTWSDTAKLLALPSEDPAIRHLCTCPLVTSRQGSFSEDKQMEMSFGVKGGWEVFPVHWQSLSSFQRCSLHQLETATEQPSRLEKACFEAPEPAEISKKISSMLILGQVLGAKHGAVLFDEQRCSCHPA